MLPQLEEKYPEGSNLTILNTFYQRPVWEDGKMVSDDFIILNFINTDTMTKDYIIIKNPDYVYYILKDKYATPDYNRLFIERDKVDPVYVPFKNLLHSIAEKTDNMEFYKTNLANRDRENNAKLHTSPRVFFSDSNIEDHYRFRFANTYTNDVCPVSKGFFDIEVDGKFAKGDFVELGECEINCVTYLDQKTSTTTTFILRNSDNPLIQQLEDEISSGRFGFKQIQEFIIQAVGGIKRAKKYKIEQLKYNVRFFDYEIELIKALFQTIHQCSPDFCLTWNGGSFDIPYIIERIATLGYDPADIMCDPTWKVKVVRNFIDERNKNDLPERGDYTFISGNVVFIDQMIQYASRRKAKYGSINSFKLDDIGLKETKVQKLDYSHITKSVTELPWLDFKTFFLYNIMDTVVQYCIEQQTQDIEYIFTKCVTNNTIYRKGHRQTVYLINRIAADFYKSGYIIGNNKNKWNEKPPKFAGALVSDPTHTNDYSKIKINGRAIWVCDNLMDFD